MKKAVIELPGVSKTDYAFSHVVQAGEMLYLTSQLSCDLKTGKILPGRIEIQTRNALANIKYLLESSGSSLEQIVKAVIYMRNASDFPEIDKAYREFFVAGQEPARVAVQAASPIKEVDVEIAVTAVTSRQSP